MTEVTDRFNSMFGVNGQGIRIKIIPFEAAKILMQEYRFITTGEVKKFILYYSDGHFCLGGENIIQAWLQENAGSYLTQGSVSEVTGHIMRSTYKDRNTLDSAPLNLLPFRNGVLDISTMTLLPNSPEYYFMQQIPHDYIAGADCPKIKKFFEEVLDKEDIDTAFEFIGFYLYRAYLLKKALLLLGKPDTGKTTFINLLNAFVGINNTSGVSLQQLAKDKFAAASMQWKYANIVDELSSNDIEDLDSFKMMTGTGHGYITGEKKFKDRFPFKNYSKLTYACNKVPAVKNKDKDDDAFYGRWLIFTFRNVFNNGKANPNLFLELSSETEMSGLAYQAIIGLNRICKSFHFTNEPSKDKVKYIMETSSANSITRFCRETLVFDNTEWISKDDLYGLYKSWAMLKGDGVIQIVTKDMFCKDFPSTFTGAYETRTGKDRTYGWSNVGIKTA